MGRECGECSLCCVIPSIPQLEKMDYSRCQYLCHSGCSIYEKRPEPCSEFECAWLSPHFRDVVDLKDNERPDKVGLLPRMATSKELGPIVVIYEAAQGAAKDYWGSKIINRLKKKHVLVVMYKDFPRELLGPPARLSRLRAHGSEALNIRP